MKTRAVLLLALLGCLSMRGQTLEKMNWFNEPTDWSIAGDRLTMSVTPRSDYWRIECADGKYNLSTVVTHRTSDWSVIALDRPVESIWIKAVRRLDAIEIFYSFDDIDYHLMRNAWMEANHPVRIGMFAACPDGDGFRASFSGFKVTHLPDKVRTGWLKENAGQ